MGKGSRPDKHLIGLVACFLVTIAGFCASVVVGVVASPDPTTTVIVAIILYGSIAILPISALHKRERGMVESGERESIWKTLGRLLRRKKVAKVKKHQVWMRKPTTYVPQPHGSEYYSTFIPDAKRKEPAEKAWNEK
jgi:hypothetical protein